MKKLLAILLALCMVMSLAACGSDSKDEDKEKDEKKTEAVESGDKKEEESPAKPEKEEEEEEEDATPSPKDPAYATAIAAIEEALLGNKEAVAELFPVAMWDTVAQGYTIELGREVTVEEAKEMMLADIELNPEDCVDEVEFTVLDEKEASDEAIEAMQESLKKYYSYSEITEAYELNVSVYAKKDGEEKTDKQTVYVVCVDDHWLLMGDDYDTYL